MSRYIKFDDAVKVMACEMYAEAQSQGYEVDSIDDFIPEAKSWMNDAPSADRPQGEWLDYEIPLEDGGAMPIQVCNLCKTFYPLAYTGGGYHFCPNCGADMREREGE